ncbi:MAG: class I SAM-dependent methyltransferase [Chloroflexota bacterium]
MTMFEEAYRQGRPPWDVPGPQGVIICLEEFGQVVGSVLDAGCGTGENALFLAGRGHEVWGVDLAPTAIAQARDKARQRGLAATFRVGDALRLGELGRTFDTVIDAGLFHALSDVERPLYVAALGQVVRPGGKYFMLCFNEHEHGPGGPRRVTQGEIREAFGGAGWSVQRIDAARFDATYGQAQAWLATVARTEGPAGSGKA